MNLYFEVKDVNYEISTHGRGTYQLHFDIYVSEVNM